MGIGLGGAGRGTGYGPGARSTSTPGRNHGDPVQRPFGISLISILIIITGVVDIIASVILLIDRNDSDVLSALDVSSSDVTTYAWVSIAIGVIVILIGNALRTGANWARLLVAMIAVIRLTTLIWVVAAYHQIH